MHASRSMQLLRDVVAILIVCVFMFPLFWWTLTSIKPDYAIFDKDGINWFNFEPTLANYQVTVFGQSRLGSIGSWLADTEVKLLNDASLAELRDAGEAGAKGR